MKIVLSVIIIVIIVICTALDAHHLKTAYAAADTSINPGTIQSLPPNSINSNSKPPSPSTDTSKKKLVLPDTFHIRW
jgi:hypothetical protein